MDQDIITLAKAIRQQESGGDYNAIGDNGTSRGAYQFQDATWKAWAGKHLGDQNAPLTRENQNKVAYYQIEEWKNKGYNPAQIAAAWNAGEGKLKNDQWKTWKGTTTINGKEIAYDTPSYVANVGNYYKQFKSQAPQIEQPVSQETPQKENNLLQSIGNAIVDPFIALGGGVANIIRPMIGQEVNPNPIPSVFGQGEVNPIGYKDGQELGAVDTTKQIAGNVAMAGSNFIGGGVVAGAGKGIVAKSLPIISQLAKGGAVAGGLQLGGKELSEGGDLPSVVTETLKGSLIGGVATPLIGLPIGLIPLATKSGRQAITKELESKYISQATDDWARVGADYVKSGGVLTKEGRFGKESTKFLSELGYSPNNFIVDGKFQTNDIADELSSTAIRNFDDTLTDMLKEAQYGKATVNLSKLQESALSKVASIKGTTEGQKQTIIKNIKSEFSALAKKYPNGVSLPELNVQKGNYWSNTRFDATKPFQSDVNYVIGSTLKEAIENNTKSAPVKELNSLLGDYYAAAKFLRSINNRVPKLTTKQKIVSTATKALGTGIGGSVGGVAGGVSGFLFGKSLAGIIDNASNPVKGYILRNLERTNPQAYTQAVQYIGEKMAERMKNVTFNPININAEKEITSAVKKIVK